MLEWITTSLCIIKEALDLRDRIIVDDDEGGYRARRVCSLDDEALETLKKIYNNDDPRIGRNEVVEWNAMLSTIQSSFMKDRILSSWRPQSLLIVGERPLEGGESKQPRFRAACVLYAHTSWARGLAFGSLLKDDLYSVDPDDPDWQEATYITPLVFKTFQLYLRGPLWFKPIRRILLEVEKPDAMPQENQQRTAIRRLKYFDRIARRYNYGVQYVDWEYRQPFPDRQTMREAAEGDELPMHLIIADNKCRTSISSAELKELLKFVYGQVYASIVDPVREEDQEYLAYLHRLIAREQCRIEGCGRDRFELVALCRLYEEVKCKRPAKAPAPMHDGHESPAPLPVAGIR